MSEQTGLTEIDGVDVEFNKQLRTKKLYKPEKETAFVPLRPKNKQVEVDIIILMNAVNAKKKITVNVGDDSVYTDEDTPAVLAETFAEACEGSVHQGGDNWVNEAAFYLKSGIRVQIEDAPYSVKDIDKLINYWKSKRV